MSAISQKSISGITSITTPAGVDNVFTVHTNDTTERFRVDLNGRVLIGTDTEGHANADNLTIATSGDTGITIRSGTTHNGRIYFSDATSGAGEYVGSLDYDHNDNKFSIFTNNGERLRIDSGGRVLIGTDTVGHPNADNLTIATSGDTGITIRSGTSNNGRIYFSDATSGTGQVVGSLDYDHNNDSFSILTGNVLRLRIDSAGRVIIADNGSGGTADVNADNFVVKNTVSNTSCGISILNADNQNSTLYFGNTSDSKHAEIVWSDASNLFLIGTSNAGASIKIRTANQSDAVFINSSGKVGIGTDNPSQALDVNGKIKVFGSDGTAYGLVISPDSSGGTYEHLIAKMNGDLRIQAGSGTYQASNANILFKNSTKHIIINAGNNGNVGINTNNPLTKLNVVGSIQAYDSATGFVTLTSTGSIELRRGDGGFIDFSTAVSEDYDCRIKQTSGNDLIFETGGSGSASEKLRIASDGVITAQKSASFGNTSDSFTAAQITASTTGISELRFADTTANAGYVKYEHSNNALILATNATPRLRIDSSGRVLIGTETQFGDGNDKVMIENGTTGGFVAFGSSAGFSEPIIGAMRAYWADNKKVAAINFFGGTDTTNKDDGSIRFATSSANNLTERLRIAPDGTVILKNTAAAVPRSDFFGSLTPLSQIASTWNAYHSLTRHDAGSPYGPYLIFAKNRNDAYNSNGIVQDNDEFGNITFQGNDGSVFREGARIRGEVEGTPGSNQMPGALTFWTNAGSGMEERLRITSSGELQLNGNTNKSVLPMYSGIFYCDANSYTKFATVTGDSLSSEIELTCHTTINAIVCTSSFIIKAGHYQDFWIESRELKYSSFTIKCISNNNQNFDIYGKGNGGAGPSTQRAVRFVIIPKNEETVTINNTVNYSGQSIVHSTQTGALKITGAGGVGCDINIAGNLTKGSGSFSIPHPLTSKKDTHNLVHSFIEGPQCDLIYRGKIDLVGGTATVNIDIATGMSNGTFVKLNRDVQCFTSNETGWGAVKGSVSGNILTITAQDNSSTDTISWMVVGERQDDVIKKSSITDNDGYLVVEPLTNEEPDNSHLHEFYPTS